MSDQAENTDNPDNQILNEVYEDLPELKILEDILQLTQQSGEEKNQIISDYMTAKISQENVEKESREKLRLELINMGFKEYDPDATMDKKARDIESKIEANKTFYKVSSNLFTVDRESLVVSDVNFKGNLPEYFGNDRINVLKAFAICGVDINDLQTGQIDDIYNKNKNLIDNILYTHNAQDKLKTNALDSILKLYEQPFSQQLQSIEINIKNPDTQTQALDKLNGLFQLFSIFTSKSPAEQTSEIRKQIVESGKSLAPENRKIFLSIMQTNSDAIYGFYAGQIIKDTKDNDWSAETMHKNVIGLSDSELRLVRLNNWNNVKTFIMECKNSCAVLSPEILTQIHYRACLGLHPNFMLGLREIPSAKFMEYREFKQSNRISNPLFEVETRSYKKVFSDLWQITNEANHLIANQNLSDKKFEAKIASLASKYLILHPHPDGNGTMVCFFIEACMVLKGYQPQEKFDENIYKRLLHSLRENSFAYTRFFTEYQLREISEKLAEKNS